MKPPALDIAGLRFAYRGQTVLDGLDLRVEAGEFIGLIGPNGAGKSTLVKLLAGVARPLAGTIRLGGTPLPDLPRREAARRLAVAPQEVTFPFPFRVYDVVLMGRHPYQSLGAVETEADHAAVRRALEDADAWRLKDRSVLELSGGEKQRVVLAGALAQETDVLALDEPTSSLDLRFQAAVFGILRRANAERGLTVLAVTHDVNLAAAFCPRLAALSAGRIVADGPPETVLRPEVLEPLYGARVEIGRRADGRPYVFPLDRDAP